MYCDFLDPNADPRVYQEVEDIDKLKLVVNDFLEEHNAESKSPMPLVMFLDAIEHVLRMLVISAMGHNVKRLAARIHSGLCY